MLLNEVIRKHALLFTCQYCPVWGCVGDNQALPLAPQDKVRHVQAHLSRPVPSDDVRRDRTQLLHLPVRYVIPGETYTSLLHKRYTPLLHETYTPVLQE